MADRQHERRPNGRLQQRTGISLALKATALLAGVFLGLFLTATLLVDLRSATQLGAVLLAAFLILAVFFDLRVRRPLREMAARSRRRLGSEACDEARGRDEIQELNRMIDGLVTAFTAAEDRAEGDHVIREDLEHMRTINRQLMEIATLGKEIAAMLPYRETVERILSHGRRFLHADFAALLLLDAETATFSLEDAEGVTSQASSADCLACTEECPVRRSIAAGRHARIRGHACALIPHTMQHLLVLPVSVEDVGEMALTAASTDGERLALLSDDGLETLRSHLQTALTNAHKHDAVRRQIVTDHLTRLYNRRHFMRRANEEIARSLRYQEPLSILMIDIDHFKEFNDTYGHATGDRVLQTVARTLLKALRTSDICARYGGEEFGVLLPSTPGESARFVAERVCRTLSETRHTDLGLPADVNVTISLGVATCPSDATDLESLLDLVDKALYRAKADGRNQVAVHKSAVVGQVRN